MSCSNGWRTRGSPAETESTDTASGAPSCFPLWSYSTGLCRNTERKSARFARDDIATDIWMITAQHSLFPPSHTRTINNLPYGLFATWITIRAKSHDHVCSQMYSQNIVKFINYEAIIFKNEWRVKEGSTRQVRRASLRLSFCDQVKLTVIYFFLLLPASGLEATPTPLAP